MDPTTVASTQQEDDLADCWGRNPDEDGTQMKQQEEDVPECWEDRADESDDGDLANGTQVWDEAAEEVFRVAEEELEDLLADRRCLLVGCVFIMVAHTGLSLSVSLSLSRFSR